VGDAEVEGTKETLPGHVFAPIATECFPGAERDGRQFQAAASAAPIRHPIVPFRGKCMIHRVGSSFPRMFRSGGRKYRVIADGLRNHARLLVYV
jgi:hypothetical protein